MDLPSILVILSTYNGEKYISKQIDSIFAQKGVDVTCYIRDDGSSDGTVRCIENLQKKYPKLLLEKGQNEGWRKSFMDALYACGDADFYAFSDQDDIWFENKLERAVQYLENLDSQKPVLYHSNRLSCYENLEPLSKQMPRVEKPIDFTNALVQEFCQGCTAVFNKATKDLACRIYSSKLPHDFWVALIAFTFGSIICENTPTMYHIHHGNNASTDGSLWASWNDRLKSFCGSSVYLIPSLILLKNYQKELSEEQKNILMKYNKCAGSFINRFIMFCNPRVKRVNFMGTISLKIAIILNKIEFV